MRFYGYDCVNAPDWILQILEKSIGMLRAEEATWSANIVRAGWAKQSDYASMVRGWAERAKPYERGQNIAKINPQAEVWFLQNGIPYEKADIKD